MGEKYVHLFNFETKAEQKKANEFLKIMPRAKLEPYGIIGQGEHREWVKSWCSLWIPEAYYMMAWTYFSYSGLKQGLVDMEDGFAYFHMQLSDEDFIKVV